LRTEISGTPIGNLTYGVLPTQMAAIVERFNVDGIIGNAALRAEVVTLSIPSGGLWIG